MEQVELQVCGLAKQYGKRRVVDNVTFSVKPQEFFAIVGPSGCGKTVLLKMIAGLERPTEGRVSLRGQDITDVPAEKRRIPMMFQSFALFPHMSVGDNVAYGLRRWGYSNEEVKKRVQSVLDLVRLGNFGSRNVLTLSGGQKQRVALARSLALESTIVMLDDPLAALDANLRISMQTELKAIHRQVGSTIIYVTGDQGEAVAVADRIAVISEGHLEQVGDSATLLASPETTFVAKFFGRNSILQGEFLSIQDDWMLVRLGEVVVRARRGKAEYESGSKVGIVAPADAVSCLPISNRVKPGLNKITGTVKDVQFSGGLFAIKVATVGGQLALAEVQDADYAKDPVKQGDSVVVSWRPSVTSLTAWT